MINKSVKFLLFFTALIAICSTGFAAPAPNPRGSAVNSAPVRTSASAMDSNRSFATEDAGVITRAAVRRGVSQDVATSARDSSIRSDATAARGGLKSRSAAPTTAVRSGAILKSSTVSRAGVSRATAVFDDVSKIGGGYSNCRDAYSSCMDQFCAKSNETYRRCYCNDKFKDYRDTELAIDQAKTLLARFEDNNLNAVDKTAAEVNAMYVATVGEAAIKKDTSSAAATLTEISDLLSGKKKSSATTISSMSLDFSADIGDIWGEDGSESIFGTGRGDISSFEGTALFNAANKQCSDMVKNSCENNAIATMSRSSYSILIGQDCNAYEKKVNAQKETVAQVVRSAEKILRAARLDEYRSNNSADVNECITKVKATITEENVCGPGYKKCLDYTGNYINANTGEPIYSPQLFKLTDLINLENANGNIVSSNQQFNKFLDAKKMFAEKALGTCQDKSTIVWNEFKRSAIIEISQAQDEKIESVKSTCVGTMKDCYDNISGGLTSFDTTSSQASGALNAYASRTMCADKVAACAALYAGPGDVPCTFDSKGRLTNTQCGLTALLGFVNLVSDVKVAEGCATALTNYAKELCTPTTGTGAYPYNCRLYSAAKLKELLDGRAKLYCTDPTTKEISSNVNMTIESIMSEINDQVESSLQAVCAELGSVWDTSGTSTDAIDVRFITNVYGGTAPAIDGRGKCVVNTAQNNCEQQDALTGLFGYAKFVNGVCVFSPEWYKYRCETSLNGLWDQTVCYVK